MLLTGLVVASAACGHQAERTTASGTSDARLGAPATLVRPPGPDDGPVAPEANPFVTTAKDAQSTFGLDVDTGSYSIGRRAVQGGTRPDASTVRVEEYVNYFAQDYTNPIGSPFGLHVDGGPTPFLAAAPSHRLVRVGVKARDIDASFRKDASLTFVIDTSGSMAQPDRLDLVKRSLHLLVGGLGPADTVAVVEFGTQSRVVLPPTSAGDPETILAAVDGLRTQGSTNAEAGLLQAYDLAVRSFKPDGINRVVLASDGGANVGAADGSVLARELSGHSAQGIQLAAFGFGMGDMNDELMEQLADKGEGFYAYIDDIDEARRLLTDKLTSTLQTVALDAKAQVTFDPAMVASYRLLGYENRDIADSQFRNDGQNGTPKADGGEIGAGHQVTALYEVELTPAADLPGTKLGGVTLHWTDPDLRQPVELSEPITTDRLAGSWDAAPGHFRLDAVVAQYAEALRGSPWAKASLADIAGEARRLPSDLRADPDVAELVTLIDQAARAR